MRRKLFSIILLGLASLLGLSLVSPYIRPIYPINANFIGLLFPLWVLSMWICMLLFYKKTPLWLTLISLVLGVIGLIQMRLYVQAGGNTDHQGITIMSYNAMMGNRMVDDRHVLTKENILQLEEYTTGDWRVDVFCGQEVNHVVDRALQANKHFPHRHKLDGISAVIYSRHPIIDRGVVDLDTRVNGCLWADIAIDDDTIRVYSAHLQSNRLTMESYHMLTDDEEYERDKAIRGMKDMLTKYHRYAVTRGDQANVIAGHRAQSPHPSIICGDFNDTPMSYTYHRLSNGMIDAFRAKGSGSGSTWSGYIPLLRIDYILSDDLLNCLSYETIHSSLSDHHPIVASFELK